MGAIAGTRMEQPLDIRVDREWCRRRGDRAATGGQRGGCEQERSTRESHGRDLSHACNDAATRRCLGRSSDCRRARRAGKLTLVRQATAFRQRTKVGSRRVPVRPVVALGPGGRQPRRSGRDGAQAVRRAIPLVRAATLRARVGIHRSARALVVQHALADRAQERRRVVRQRRRERRLFARRWRHDRQGRNRCAAPEISKRFARPQGFGRRMPSFRQQPQVRP